MRLKNSGSRKVKTYAKKKKKEKEDEEARCVMCGGFPAEADAFERFLVSKMPASFVRALSLSFIPLSPNSPSCRPAPFRFLSIFLSLFLLFSIYGHCCVFL